MGEDSRQISLQNAIETCGIPMRDTLHNALHDAMYTAAVSAWITEEALAYRPPGKKKRRERSRTPKFSPEQFPAQPKYRIGPYPAMQAVLNAKRARQPRCPVCGRELCVHRWSGPVGRCYYAAVGCNEHGHFLCRLTLARLENGEWRGRISVPAITPELEKAYQRALETGTVNCTGSTRRKKKRRRRERRPARQPETAS